MQYCFGFCFIFCYIGIVTLAGVCSLPFRLAHTRAYKHIHITYRELRVPHMESRRIQQVKRNQRFQTNIKSRRLNKYADKHTHTLYTAQIAHKFNMTDEELSPSRQKPIFTLPVWCELEFSYGHGQLSITNAQHIQK